MSITPERIRAAMRKLQAVCPDENNRVFMDKTMISKDPECGMVACFGGWCYFAYQTAAETVSWSCDGWLEYAEGSEKSFPKEPTLSTARTNLLWI